MTPDLWHPTRSGSRAAQTGRRRGNGFCALGFKPEAASGGGPGERSRQVLNADGVPLPARVLSTMPIRPRVNASRAAGMVGEAWMNGLGGSVRVLPVRSEEHTSELQSRENLVCRLL